jgi:hypothetical protein
MPVTAVSNPRGMVAALSKDRLEGIYIKNNEILYPMVVIDGLTFAVKLATVNVYCWNAPMSLEK